MIEDPQHEYHPEEITPATMWDINHFLERQAINNRTFNGRFLVNSYECDTCGTVHFTVDMHVGTTPYLSDCSKPGCGGTAVSRGYKPRKHVDDYAGPIDFEWYRPLREDECETLVALIDAEARSLANHHAFPTEPERREWYVDIGKQERAKHVLTGGLVKRPRTP